MRLKIQWIAFLLLCCGGTGFSQTFHYGVSDTYYNHCLYDLYGYPCGWHYTVYTPDRMPVKKEPEIPELLKKFPTEDPIRSRLDKRMAEIDSSGFVNTNTVQMEIVPGLTPKN